MRASSVVYFILDPALSSIKIGTTNNIKKRLHSLDNRSRPTLELLGTTPGWYVEEAGWHEKFGHLRICREWFRDCQELREAIKASGATLPNPVHLASPPKKSLQIVGKSSKSKKTSKVKKPQKIRKFQKAKKIKDDLKDRIWGLHLSGVSRKKIASMLNQEGIKGPRGGKWQTTSVCRWVRQKASNQGEPSQITG